MSDNAALPQALAAELRQHFSFSLLEKLLAHRKAYLLMQLATPKKRRECQRIWGQLEEVRWLSQLEPLTEMVLKP